MRAGLVALQHTLPGPVSASPVFGTEGRVYVATLNGTLLALQVDLSSRQHRTPDAGESVDGVDISYAAPSHSMCSSA